MVGLTTSYTAPLGGEYHLLSLDPTLLTEKKNCNQAGLITDYYHYLSVFDLPPLYLALNILSLVRDGHNNYDASYPNPH